MGVLGTDRLILLPIHIYEGMQTVLATPPHQGQPLSSSYKGLRTRRRLKGSMVRILGGPLHPVIGSIRENKDYIGVLFYSYYTTIAGWGVLLIHIPSRDECRTRYLTWPRCFGVNSSSRCLPRRLPNLPFAQLPALTSKPLQSLDLASTWDAQGIA